MTELTALHLSSHNTCVYIYAPAWIKFYSSCLSKSFNLSLEPVINNQYPSFRHTAAVFCVLVALSGCGSDSSGESETITDEPITPTYGVNEFAYKGMGFDTLLASGLN
jgi:hypothetical protein